MGFRERRAEGTVPFLAAVEDAQKRHLAAGGKLRASTLGLTRGSTACVDEVEPDSSNDSAAEMVLLEEGSHAARCQPHRPKGDRPTRPEVREDPPSLPPPSLGADIVP